MIQDDTPNTCGGEDAGDRLATQTVHLPFQGGYVLSYDVGTLGVPRAPDGTGLLETILVNADADDPTQSVLFVFTGELPVTPSTMLVSGFFSTNPRCATYQSTYDSQRNRLECRFPIPRNSGDTCIWNAQLKLMPMQPLVKVTIKISRL